MKRTLADEEGEAPEPCTHPNTEMRLWILRNQTTAIYLQCLECGESASQAIKKNSLTPEQFKALPPYDVSFRDERRAETQARWKIYQEQKEQNWTEKQKQYHAYLATPEWKLIRRQVMARDDYICQSCLVEGRHGIQAEHVHHLTYAHIFHERLYELVALCESCHKTYHKDWV